MVPLLLLLLLSESLADQVCLYVSDGKIIVNMTDAVQSIINVTVFNMVDERSGPVTCKADGVPCLFLCTSHSNESWFNGSSDCLEADVKPPPAVVIRIEPYSNCSLYLCQLDIIMPLLESLDSDSSDQEDMMKLFYIKSSCSQLFSSNHKVKQSFISAERQMIHNIMGTSTPEPGRPINHNLKLLSLNVFNIRDAVLNSSNPSRIQIAAPQLLPQNASFIPEVWLPADALDSIPEERRIGVVTYVHQSQFQFKEEEISSMVLRIELLGKQHLHDLETPIKMTFRIVQHTDMNSNSPSNFQNERKYENGTWFQCHYFDEHDFLWKTDGCETDDDQKDVICYCSHSTPFAVLLMRDPIAGIHWQILSYISYIGCGLSAFFTALSLVIYVFSRNHRMDYSISIHVSLSGALFLLNTSFLLTEWGATVEPHWVCVFVAALTHYSLLCCFTWMAIEALHLYLLLIKVFNTYFKHYLVKLSLAGWGIPGVIVAVSLGMKDFKQFYGLTQMTMADTNQTNAICWITDDSFFYSSTLVYFTLIFIFNSGILVTVASNICKMKQVFRSTSKLGAEAEGNTPKNSERFNETCRSGLTVMGLTCLMGTTWGLAFLGSGYVNYPILYLFCILNSIQGFFIFLWICLSTNKQRKRDMEDRLTSSAVKTSGSKLD